MKKIFALFIIVALLIPTLGASAQSGTSAAPGTWVSSINIQNLGSSPANVVLNFYDTTGTLAQTFTVSPAIPAGGSRSLYVPTDVGGLSSGQFSVVASSDQPLKVVVNLSSTAPYTAGAYEGLDSNQTGTVLYFPGLYNNYYGFYSELVLQNAGSSTANISIQFYNQKTGAAVGSPYTDTIAIGASKVYTLSTLSPALPSGNATGIYSAKVTSTNAVAIGGLANAWSSALHGEFATYDGMISGAGTSFTPALYNNYYGFVSSLTVQNISGSSTNITVTYSNGTVATATLAANQATEFFIPNNTSLPAGNSTGVFSAKVTSSGGSIITLVNSEDKTKGSLASYNGAIAATNSINCPVVMKSFYQWFSAETVQNVGTAATNITVTYASGQTRTFNNIQPNGTINVIELATASPASILPDGSSVSATFTSSGQPIVAVVQENSNDRYAANPGDYLLAYTCSAQ